MDINIPSPTVAGFSLASTTGGAFDIVDAATAYAAATAGMDQRDRHVTDLLEMCAEYAEFTGDTDAMARLELAARTIHAQHATEDSTTLRNLVVAAASDGLAGEMLVNAVQAGMATIGLTATRGQILALVAEHRTDQLNDGRDRHGFLLAR